MPFFALHPASLTDQLLPPAPLAKPNSSSSSSTLHHATHHHGQRSLWLWGVLLCLTLAWDASGADLRVMAWLGSPQGFALRDHWWLGAVLHDGARQVALLIYLGVLVMAVWPMGRVRHLSGLQRLEIVTGITLSLLLINLVKRTSLTSCPWDLQAFGGTATYVSHWAWGVADGGSGFCFPGGHASSALAFLALSLPGLASQHPHWQRRAWVLTGLIVIAGLVLGGVQTLRGAHYPSHTAWTALLCAAAAWANHGLFAWYGDAKGHPQAHLHAHPPAHRPL
jgi:membrane-associated PAP2 superfamily phosphatase